MYLKSNCKYIIGINLIDMDHINFVKLTLLFSEYVLPLFVQFSGYLLDFAFPGICCKYTFVPFLQYQELPQLQVSILVLGATFVLLRFPGPCILIFFQMINFYPQKTPAQPKKGVVFIIFNCIIRFISINLLYVCIAKSQRIKTISVSTAGSALCSYQFYGVGLCDVRRSSYGCIDRFCHVYFQFQKEVLQDSQKLSGLQIIIVATHSTFGINPIFYYSGLAIPGAEALVLCSSHDKSLCKKPQMDISFV